MVSLGLLTVSAIVSISLFEALWTLAILWAIFEFRRHPRDLVIKKNHPRFWIGLWVLTYSLTTAVASLPDMPKVGLGEFWGKIWERGFYVWILPATWVLSRQWKPKDWVPKLWWLHLGVSIVMGMVWFARWILKKDVWTLGWWGIFEIAQWFGIWALLWFIQAGRWVTCRHWLKASLGLIMGLFLLSVTIFSGRRSCLMGFVGAAFWYWTPQLKKKSERLVFFLGLIAVVILFVFWHRHDPRWEILNHFMTGKVSFSEMLTSFSSSRWTIAQHAWDVWITWWKNADVFRLLLGGGLWVGLYNPIGPSLSGMFFESLVFISETLERGLVGFFLIVVAYGWVLIRGWQMRSQNWPHAWLGLFLLNHLFVALHTTWWDALLPYFLILWEWGQSLTESDSDGKKF